MAKKKQRHVIRFTESEEIEVVVMGELGFSTQAIADETGLSKGQVLYRLRLAQVKRADYRNGKSDTAERVLDTMRRPLEQHVKDEVAPRFAV